MTKKISSPSLREQLQVASSKLLVASRNAAPQARPLGFALAGALSVPAALAGTQPGDWQLRSAILFYSEADRVTAIEPVIEASRYFENDRIFSTKLVIDVLTGASASGAVPSGDFQTFTRPSGNGRYITSPGDTPLDDTFLDTRVALSANWTQPLLKNLTGTLGLNASKEYDYLSLGLNGVLNWDLNRKNSTLTMGLGLASDEISPEGSIPTPFGDMAYSRGDANAPASDATHDAAQAADDTERASRSSSDTKSVADFLIGWTQVIDRSTIAQFNYSLSMSDGYLTDPFKVVSVVDSTTGDPLRQLYENRPDSRSKNSVFARVKRAIGEDDVLDASYRYLWDDWGLTSHTLDLRYRLGLGAEKGKHALIPHLRYYQQTAADFYQPFLLNGQALPSEVSADYRLGDMDTITVGLEYAHQMRNEKEWRIALEYYLQSPKEPGNKPGQLAGQTLAPEVDAIMLRMNFDFGL